MVESVDILESRRALRTRLGATAEHVDDEAWQRLEQHFTLHVLPGGTCLVRAGEAARAFGYVISGSIREYYATPEGREYNKAFGFAGDLTGSLADLLSRGPSTVTIEALEATRLWVAPYARLQHLFETDPAWQRAGRLFAEMMFSYKARREFELLTMSAQQRYQALLDRRPDLELRVPQYHVASFLGITPVALSRIRARMAGLRSESSADPERGMTDR